MPRRTVGAGLTRTSGLHRTPRQFEAQEGTSRHAADSVSHSRLGFALFAGLLAFGLLQTQNRNVKKTLAYALPAGMVALSLSGILSSFGLTPLTLAAWASGLIVVTLFAYKVFPHKGISLNRANNTFYIPGTWTPLASSWRFFSPSICMQSCKGSVQQLPAVM